LTELGDAIHANAVDSGLRATAAAGQVRIDLRGIAAVDKPSNAWIPETERLAAGAAAPTQRYDTGASAKS